MFTTSLFLEVLVNDRPIMIRYGENRAFPAVRDLANTWLFFIDGPFRTFDRSEDYGIPGEGPLDYKAFGGIVADPAGSFGPIEQQRLQELKGLSEEISQTQQEVDELLEDGDEPEEWLVEDLDAARDDLKRLEFQIENFDLCQRRSLHHLASLSPWSETKSTRSARHCTARSIAADSWNHSEELDCNSDLSDVQYHRWQTHLRGDGCR